MILKIKNPSPNAHSWRIIDNVRNLHYSAEPFQDETTTRNKIYADGREESAEREFYLIERVGNGFPDDMMLFMSFDDGAAKEIYADTQVFLMNDEGRNIERLY